MIMTKEIMKKYFKYTLMLMVLFATSCSKDFLENKPTDSLDPSKIDESKIGEMRNAIYAYIGGSQVFKAGYVDNAYSRNAWDSNGLIVQQNTLTSAINEGYSYSGIRNTNMLIHYLDILDLDQSIKDKYRAEARVMRAWIYMRLTMTFGDVPLVTVYNEPFPDGIARTPKEEIRKWVINEFKEAISALPEKNDPNRYNKYMAEALLARAAYYFGDYQLAKTSAQNVIDKGGYQLYRVGELTGDQKDDAELYKQLITDPNIDKDKFIKGIFNYNNLWNVDNNPETIIAKEYFADTEEYADFVRFSALLCPYMTDKQGWNTVAPIQDLVDSYWTASGDAPTVPTVEERKAKYRTLREEVDAIGGDYQEAVKSIANDLASKPYLDEFKNRDSRLYATIVFPFSPINYYVKGGYGRYEFEVANYGQSGYSWRKASGGENHGTYWGGGYYLGGNDVPLVRLAEMYLILAESTVHVEGYNSTAQDALNMLRDRCGMPNVDPSLGKNEALDMIRKERRIELAGEGLRYYDIRLYEDPELNGGYKGTQAASVVMQGVTYDIEGHKCVDKQWDARLMYMPIPVTALDKNPLLEQNNGY